MIRICDVLVIGAGPAGSSAALKAAEAGCSVMLIDKRNKIGQPVQCAEYVPRLLLRETDISEKAIAQDIAGMLTFLPNGKIIETNSPGFILNRDVFDRDLAELAVVAGADLKTSTFCTSKTEEAIILAQGQNTFTIRPKIIIGADGYNSTVGKWMGSVNLDYIRALQYTVPLAEPLQSTEVYFSHELFGGYGWLFPKGGVANVGIGVKSNPYQGNKTNLRKLMDGFVNSLASRGKLKNTPSSIIGGLIPAGGPLKTIHENIMLVGDAAGHTDAITGGGIPQAVICGKMAGKAAARAIEAGDLKWLDKYEKEWQLIFGRALQNAYEKRQLLESGWKNLDTVIKKCWIAFGEYYEQ